MTKLYDYTVIVSQESKCGLAGSLQLSLPHKTERKVLAGAVVTISFGLKRIHIQAQVACGPHWTVAREDTPMPLTTELITQRCQPK